MSRETVTTAIEEVLLNSVEEIRTLMQSAYNDGYAEAMIDTDTEGLRSVIQNLVDIKNGVGGTKRIDKKGYPIVGEEG